MRSSMVALLPTWRTPYQAEIIAYLAGRHDDVPLAEIARDTGIAPTTIYDEITRLTTAALTTERRAGRARLVRLNTNHPCHAALVTLAEYTFGAIPALTTAFANINAEQVIIFGSWAARHQGTSGPPPNDIDVLVLGPADNLRNLRKAAFAAAATAEHETSLPVHVVVRDIQDWAAPSHDPLLAEIAASPHIPIVGA